MKKVLNNILSNPYENYIYSYPHKKAYGEFKEPIPLEILWGNSEFKNLTLYIHIPFCMNKCGYCNLLSTTCFGRSKMKQYVDQMIQEMIAVQKFLGITMKEASPFSSVIFGGGTPTILEDIDLKRLLEAISSILYVDFSEVFFSMETSPRTITQSKLNLLKEYHVDRVSMGVQSFNNRELSSIYRRESPNEIERALELLFSENISVRNLDLIYGIPYQTIETWKESLQKTIEYGPEEIYLYPLYIREKTKLYTSFNRDIELMSRMYEFGRQFLKENNYIQTSMRNFIRKDQKTCLFPEYSCQENEMIGIGCGARSYRDNVHYSRKYAVEEKNINKIIDEYLTEKDFSVGSFGYLLNEDELKRRYILKSILKVTGLDIDDYTSKFKTSPLADFKELEFLMENDILLQKGSRIYPTEKGLMCSDAIGSLFISREVKRKVANYKEDLIRMES